MRINNNIKSLVFTLLCSPVLAHAMTVDELAAQFEAYKQQQANVLGKIVQENTQLKQQNQALKTKIATTLTAVEINTNAVETIADNMQASVGGWFERTSLGAYGELHYTNRSKEAGDHQEESDFHRFVIFLGHEFTDKLRLYSELELEHSIAGDGKNGEIELEQAYLEYDISPQLSAKAGLFIMPVGIMNETHEPATFYGVERNEVEKRIIPATWWEAGIGTAYKFDNGVSAEVAVTTGLNLNDDYDIRKGRGKVSKQTANDPIIAARVKYTGIPGLEVAASILHQTDMGQSSDNVDIGAGTLYEGHTIYSHSIGIGTFTGKALYSHWDIDANNSAAESQYGWYLEPSYKVPTDWGDVGIYARFQQLDYFSGSVKNYDIWETGASWWLHENVVLKANYVYKQDTLQDNHDENGFDLGVGYHF